jgi:large subunit ribosomal protein L4
MAESSAKSAAKPPAQAGKQPPPTSERSAQASRRSAPNSERSAQASKRSAPNSERSAQASKRSAPTSKRSAQVAEAPVLSTHPPGTHPPASKKVKLDLAAFGERFRGPLVHQSVRAEQAARRRGTAATKTRGTVAGGGAKPWRQKGTGRARAGSNRSPLWAGGGVVFGPQPRSYTFKVNRKELRAALRSALSLHAQRGSVALVDPASFDEPETNYAAELLDGWQQPRPTLVVLDPQESVAALSFRNLRRVAVLTPEQVGVTDVVGAASLVLSQTALDALTARAAASPRGSTAPEAARPTPKPAKPTPKPAKPSPKSAKPSPKPDEADGNADASRPLADDAVEPAETVASRREEERS